MILKNFDLTNNSIDFVDLSGALTISVNYSDIESFNIYSLPPELPECNPQEYVNCTCLSITENAGKVTSQILAGTLS